MGLCRYCSNNQTVGASTDGSSACCMKATHSVLQRPIHHHGPRRAALLRLLQRQPHSRQDDSMTVSCHLRIHEVMYIDKSPGLRLSLAWNFLPLQSVRSRAHSCHRSSCTSAPCAQPPDRRRRRRTRTDATMIYHYIIIITLH